MAQESFEEEMCLPLSKMPLNEVGTCFTVLHRQPGSMATGKLGCVLKFTVKEIDPSTREAEEEGYDDEYQVGGCAVVGHDVCTTNNHQTTVATTNTTNCASAWESHQRRAA